MFLLFCNFVLAATHPSLRFLKPQVDGEAYREQVVSALIDKNTFSWFCTHDGLVRYDGYTLKRYEYKDDNPNSISGNSTTAILEDKNGYLWIGTANKGLNRFDPQTEVFTRYLPSGLEQTTITHLYQDSFGSIWISTELGLYQLDPSAETFLFYRHDKNDLASINSNDIREVLEDVNQKGNLWVATGNGLDYFNHKTQAFLHYTHDDNITSSLSNDRVHDLIYDSNNVLWIGTSSGLNQYSPTTDNFSHYYPSPKTKHLPDNNNAMFALHEDNYGQFWIGTFYEGLKIFDPQKGAFIGYSHQPYNPYSLRANWILPRGIFSDSRGLLWVLTMEGINQLDLSEGVVKSYQHEKNNADSLSSNIIWGIYEDPQQQLWVGTNDNGLNLFDESQKRFIHYRHNPEDPTSLSSNRVFSILVDSDQTLWVGTDRGLNRRDKGETVFQHYTFNPVKGLEQSTTYIVSLQEDLQGDIWLATSQGLRRFNKKSRQFTTYLHDSNDPESLVSNWINWIYIDNSERLWVGTEAGLDRFNPKTETFTHFKHEPKINASLANNTVRVITQTKDKSLWVGTSQGISHLDLNTLKFENFQQKDGLIHNLVMGLIEDDNENLWIITGAGLSKFNPKTKSAPKIYPGDRMQNIGFNSLAFTKRRNGEIVLGSPHGIVRFFPSDLSNAPQPPEIAITDFLVFNKTTPLVSSLPSKNAIHEPNTKENTYYLEQSIIHTEEIILSHKESMFSFEFAALSYLRANKNQYAYKMVGLDKDWIYTPATKRFATYMNIPAGEYVFKVKGSNKNGVWNEEGRSIKVIILPPPWLTWWAKTLYAIFIITSLLGFYVYRTKALRRRAIDLEKTVKNRTVELAEEKQKVENLLTQKTEEFANVSHEFRTPLTLVLGPLAQLLKRHQDPEDQKQLNIIQRNGYRLLRMVDQLLNLETFRVKPTSQKTQINTAQSIKLITEAFAELASQKNITLNISKLIETNFEFTADAFEKIVLNLLSNALKYTKTGGSITIETTRENNELTLQITDTGIGIPNDKLDDIFERFNRVLDNHSEQITGAGIGLALVKSLVESHQGTIDITSEPGQGTCVKVTLPIINEVDETKVKSRSNHEIIEMEIVSLTEQAKPTAVDGNLPTLPKDNERPTVLIIEDNQDMRDYIVGSLDDDYRTIIAENGEQGIKLAKQEVPDLIISDIMMPKKDGFETTKELRSNDITNHIPIILLTALGDHENRIKGWQEKADEYLTKPFNTEELKTRIVNLLDIRNILKRRFSETVFVGASSENPSTITNELTMAEKNRVQQQQLFVSQVNERLESLYSDASTSVADIASSLAMSERQILRKLKSTLDMTPIEYLRRFRLEKAKEQLRQGQSATNTAFDVGFSSQSYFTKCFRAQYGLPPGQYIHRN